MKEKFQNELKNAIKAAQNDEVLNNEELNATEGGSNVSLGDCSETTINSGNCVVGCACTITKPEVPSVQ